LMLIPLGKNQLLQLLNVDKANKTLKSEMAAMSIQCP
jgi:hypothetical protein